MSDNQAPSAPMAKKSGRARVRGIAPVVVLTLAMGLTLNAETADAQGINIGGLIGLGLLLGGRGHHRHHSGVASHSRGHRSHAAKHRNGHEEAVGSNKEATPDAATPTAHSTRPPAAPVVLAPAAPAPSPVSVSGGAPPPAPPTTPLAKPGAGAVVPVASGAPARNGPAAGLRSDDLH